MPDEPFGVQPTSVIYTLTVTAYEILESRSLARRTIRSVADMGHSTSRGLPKQIYNLHETCTH